MLVSYETAVQRLIQLVNTNLIPTATLDAYINIARKQVAADAECVRGEAALTTSANLRTYPFSAMTLPANFDSVITVRQIRFGNLKIDFRPFEWLFRYYEGDAPMGIPQRAAQQGQGVSGNLYLDPTPDTAYLLSLDVAALPIALVDDTTPEIIPYPWTDAVPFYAAGYAFMQLQRQTDAQQMFARYAVLAQRGRQESTPTVLPDNMPGGLGAHSAALKTTLTAMPQRGSG